MRNALRHFLSTIYYRGLKYFSGYNETFKYYHPNESQRSPAEILNHINGLILYTKSLFIENKNTYPELLDLDKEVIRFKKIVKELDDILKSSLNTKTVKYEQILQGPFADIMLHIGELSMIRKIINDPADDYENYLDAPIIMGVFDE